MSRRDIPPQWLPLLEKERIHSARQLADRLGIGPSTATRLLHGEQTSPETIERVATLLKEPAAKIRELRGEVVLPPFRLPVEADQLTPRQRQAVLAVVRAMLDPAPDEARQTSELEADLSAALGRRGDSAEVPDASPPVTLSERRSRKGRPRP